MNGAVSLTNLRWSRSDPPGLAAEDERRRATYCAALQQFEELLATSRVAGPASKPLPLFYALSQAGRAIVAAFGASPHTHGHGLGEAAAADSSTPLLHRRIRRRANRHGDDTFGAVARATGSGDFDGDVELGALWVANPDAPRLPLEHWQPDWRLALFVVDDNAQPPGGVELHEQARLLRVLPFSEPLEATSHHGPDLGHERYPTIPDHAGATFVARELDAGKTWNGYIIVRDDWATVDEVAPRPAFGDDRYLVPLLPGQQKMLSPLLLWWVLLYGFSVFARYHPELWLRTLDVDRSSAAVGIEHLLTKAVDRLPHLVYQSLLGKPYPIPKACRLT